MARLPKIGEEVWGEVLNEYLLVAHNTDGTEREKAYNALAASVGLSDLKTTNASGEVIKNLRLSNDGTNLVWRRDTLIDVRDYGAVGDGMTDDTAAIQAAIDAATQGGSVVFPRGIYMVTGIKLKANGTLLVGGARFGTRIVRLSGTQPLIDMSGTGTLAGHLKYCGLENIMIHGNYLPGTLVRSYYIDNHIFMNVSFVHCDGTALDFVEAWDSRFDNCSWEDCGNASQPATLFRNSTPSGTFGYSTDNTNQVHFVGCRWEGFRNGAIQLYGAANGSPNLLNGVFFISCKMETWVAAGPALQILPGTTIVFIEQLYIAIMSFDTGYSTPIDAVIDSGSYVFATALYAQWGPGIGLANSLVHAVSGNPHMYHEVGSFYPTEDPASGTIVVEAPANVVTISCISTNRGKGVVGNVATFLQGGQTLGYMFPLDNIGMLKVVSTITNLDLFSVSNSGTRPALQVPNSVDLVGFSDTYVSEKWRIVGASGGAKFAAGKFQIEPTKGYVGIGVAAYTGIALQVQPTTDNDRGLAIVRPTSTASSRLLEFQDETHNIQGQAFDSSGRPMAVGTPPRVDKGDQTTYANPRVQVRDIAGNVTAAVRPSPTAPGVIASITFARPYAAAPLVITINDHSAVAANLYVSARSATGFTVSTRSALTGGSILNFDYTVIA